MMKEVAELLSRTIKKITRKNKGRKIARQIVIHMVMWNRDKNLEISLHTFRAYYFEK